MNARVIPIEPESQKIIACKDCNSFRRGFWEWLDSSPGICVNRAVAGEWTNYATGSSTVRSQCVNRAREYGKCGPQAEYFEAKK